MLGRPCIVHLDGVVEDDERVPDEEVRDVPAQRGVHAAVEEGALGSVTGCVVVVVVVCVLGGGGGGIR